MSDTPRTDNEFVKAFEESDYPTTHITEWAMKLEREADKLARQCVRNVEEIGQLRAALEQSQKREAMSLACIQSWKEDEGADAARLVWILDSLCVMDSPHDILSSRVSIDAAMEAQNDDV